MKDLEKDKLAIYYEQQATFRYIFDSIDMDKIAFVGGVADYINLRDYYKMPVHDLDIIYQDERDLQTVIEQLGVKKYYTKFYKFDQKKVLVTQYKVNGKSVHIDFFKRNNIHKNIITSTLLGQKVRHASFQRMKVFHNNQISSLTSDALNLDYEWKRLYKHSKKASLYNMVTYQQEKLTKELAHV